ncbi:hypothetical protein A2303_01230 [Candidatus Falkowbacteria bacterium RIFOXYB2_FULL_47_14]|uniref:DUF3135 domain-containing protein n=1 Tax=Candidatus Falkowbacteria bacterium RIFOXYA2_FULL_47_19 TaxID=1797994 RepID=A0A1F5SKG9_9BACT|nr:MAG: hypothetical protein A2227_06070 [Candidatus Falkowbacteria bacterium RIFOXYA2_FULL_47_19]OGF34474.1 MAG: hypothetical protein A2468_04570 [Candidatus Falkowbacteria bacterium RIFOXYC2_FULL_46_15]OGF43513.1 MAG: hypothetical protein A2303_01230 [Candidatus Falkowbacteria bacterium RIFOXYB2_FULL_47_14]
MGYPKVDIEELFRLAAADPAGFEKKSRELIRETIEAASPEARPKLTGLQWKIEQERRRFKGSPEQYAGFAFGLMWESFRELNSSLAGFRKSADKMTEPKPELKLIVNNKEEKN